MHRPLDRSVNLEIVLATERPGDARLGPNDRLHYRATLSQRSLTCHQPDSTVIEPSWRTAHTSGPFPASTSWWPISPKAASPEERAQDRRRARESGRARRRSRARLRRHPPASRGDGRARLEPRRRAGHTDRARRGRPAAPSRSSRAGRSSTRARRGRRRCRRCATTTSTPTSCSRSPPSSASRFLGCGFRPFGRSTTCPGCPRAATRSCAPICRRAARLAHEMMKRTATVQANFDYESDERTRRRSCASRMGMSSLVTALFAASPLVDGKPSGLPELRARAWLDTDDDRCGLLPFAFDPDAQLSRLRRVGAGRADVLRLPRRRVSRRRDGMTFRRFMAKASRASARRWPTGRCTCRRCSPRCASRRSSRCAGPTRRRADGARAARALARHARRRRRPRQAAWSLVADWSFDERLRVYRETPMKGLHGSAHGRPMRELCRELVAIARAGLGSLGANDELPLLGAARAHRRERPHGRRRHQRRVAARRRRHRSHDRVLAPALTRLVRAVLAVLLREQRGQLLQRLGLRRRRQLRRLE